VVNFTEEDPFDPRPSGSTPSTSAPCPSKNSAANCCRSSSGRLSIRRRENAQITPLIQERIRLLRDVLTVADFFFADELPPYDPPS
jgi:hypothetical protein